MFNAYACRFVVFNPQDFFEKAVPFQRIKVHLTGKLLQSHKLNCVKEVVMYIIPADDLVVKALVESWPAEVDFSQTVGRLSGLNKVSRKYQYNAVALKHHALKALLSPRVFVKNENIIMRPADRKGQC